MLGNLFITWSDINRDLLYQMTSQDHREWSCELSKDLMKIFMHIKNKFRRQYSIKILPFLSRDSHYNKANMRDLIAMTSLVILLKLDSNTFLVCMTLKFNGLPKKTIGHLFYTTSSFVHHFKSISEFRMKLQLGNTQFRWTFLSRSQQFFGPMWPWNLPDDLEKHQGICSMLLQALCIIL